MARVNTDLFKLVCSITDQHSAEITATNVKEIFGHDGFENSIAANALIKSPHLQDIDVEIDGEERSYPLQRHNGGMAYFSPSSGWVPVKQDDLFVCKINFEWFLRAMMDALEIPATTQPQMIVEDKAWFLGSAYLKKKKTPLIFARAVTKKDAADGLFEYLQDKHAGVPALVLTSSSGVPAYFQLPGQNRLVFMSDAVDFENQKLAFKTSYLAEKMGGYIEQYGFSEGYRTLHLNDQTFTFTAKKSSVLEIMDKVGKPMHQRDIMAQSESVQDRLIDLFRGDPAWGVIIKNDKKGNYWLEY